ncbi:NAD+ synthase [Legionella sp. CNM-4043-24]|uniref:NAD+ synthase n=1 Tax=Legionella sp. CNM-4043-24 TaxID=3421646 RepID=UPI00403B103B
MKKKTTLLMAQINPTVGAIQANTQKIIQIIEARQSQHDVIVFPELAVCGYPPEDLLLRPDFQHQIDRALEQIAQATRDTRVIVGHPSRRADKIHNSASVFYQGARAAIYHKQQLPNYGVFDERRYFTPGAASACVIEVNNHRFSICICEDIWHARAVDQALEAGADTMLCLNASPFHDAKHRQREELLVAQAERGLAIVYVNTVGGQDELVFDGQSLVLDKQGSIRARAPAFVESLTTIDFEDGQIKGSINPLPGHDQLIYEALVCGLRDYVEKNAFPGVLLGLSGGIDSALTLAIAVDALGADRVQAVMMPSRYTADMSGQDAEAQLTSMNVRGSVLPIEPAFQALLTTLEPSFAGLAPDTTEENMQARIRGLLLMALSNKTGYMVLTTSNKSETAVGYSTLYGDMAGGFAVLKDVLKTQVYELARYRNQRSPVIPERVLTRAPSAELAANQTDQDSLPDYALLDAIIKDHMEHNLSAEALINAGYPAAEVHQILKLIKRNEYKRRQAAPGIKISNRAFGRDWRYPITSGFREYGSERR